MELHQHNRHGIGNIILEIDDNNDNYINIDYLDKNNEDIEKNNISSNLGKIHTNKNNISSNLSEITYIKNNSKSYLKNVYNISYYNVKKINFDNNFYNKTFELNAKKRLY